MLWFTGLSGAGKSTIANLVEKRLHALGHHTMILDGDNVRHGLNRDLGFSEADRVENIRRIAEVSRLFVEAGPDRHRVVHLALSRRTDAGARPGRRRTSSWRSSSIPRSRNAAGAIPKGLYQKADAGQIRNFTGVDAPYEEPLDPEIRLRTLEGTPEVLADEVVAALRTRGIIA